MPVDGGRVQDLMSYYAVVSALIVTVTYSAVLAPPRELSSTTDLSQASTARLVFAMRAAFGMCLPQRHSSTSQAMMGSTQTCQPADDVDVNKLLWGVGPHVVSYLDAFDTSDLPKDTPGELSDPAFQAFVVFNAFALIFSLVCIAVGVLYTHSAMVRDEITGGVENLESIRRIMKWTLLISLLCAFVAFNIAHAFVFMSTWTSFALDDVSVVGVNAAWILSMAVVLAMTGFTCWLYRGNLNKGWDASRAGSAEVL